MLATEVGKQRSGSRHASRVIFADEPSNEEEFQYLESMRVHSTIMWTVHGGWRTVALYRHTPIRVTSSLIDI